jgi:CcmD family protein
MSYLFAAYVAIWCVLFGYIWTLKSRQNALEGRVNMLMKKMNTAEPL